MREVNLLRTSRVPALSTNKVANVGPLDGVRASVTVGVGHITTAVGPEGVVITVVLAGRARGRTLRELVQGIRTFDDRVVGNSQNSLSCGEAEEKVLGKHVEETWLGEMIHEAGSKKRSSAATEETFLIYP